MTVSSDALTLEARARQSLGSSHDAIYHMVDQALTARGIGGGRLVDVGCGSAGLWRRLAPRFERYCGLDAVRYHGFPVDAEFCQVDLDLSTPWPIAVGEADVVTAVETIEHLENPWAFFRALVAFQDAHYPAHRTALLEVDLRRAARECGLQSVDVLYSHAGRVPFTPWHYPAALAARLPRRLSDNLLIIGRKPA